MPEKFTVVKKGYDTFEVDRYVESIEEVVKSYKDKDASIKNAILNAQIAADNIVKNAERQAEEMQKEAAAKLEGITRSVQELKNLVDSFEEDYNAFLHKYLSEFDNSGAVKLRAALGKLDDYLTGSKIVPIDEL
jgi:cell division septum initiation protein DivIVA